MRVDKAVVWAGEGEVSIVLGQLIFTPVYCLQALGQDTHS